MDFRDVANVLHDRSDVFVAVVVETFLNDTRKFPGYGICGKQDSGFKRLKAKLIFGGSEIVFNERSIVIAGQRQLCLAGQCVGE